MTDNVTQLPDLSVVLDLDNEERDPADIKPPFVAKVGGKAITFADPSDIDWRDLVDVDHPGQLLRVSLSKEDKEHILTTDLPSWKFSKLMQSYYEHYDFEKKIEDARRRAAFEGRTGAGRL